MIEGLIKYNLQLQAEAIGQFKKLLNINYDPAVDPTPLYDAVNRRLDEAIRLQKRVVYLERLKLNGKNTKKIVCPRCKGNGYIKIPHESVETLTKSVISQCSMCDMQGEIDELEDRNIPQLNDDPERMH